MDVKSLPRGNETRMRLEGYSHCALAKRGRAFGGVGSDRAAHARMLRPRGAISPKSCSENGVQVSRAKGVKLRRERCASSKQRPGPAGGDRPTM
jgi:hypothetical protein